MKIKSLASLMVIMIIMSAGCTPKPIEIPIESNVDPDETVNNRLTEVVMGKERIPDNQNHDMYDQIGFLSEIGSDKVFIEFAGDYFGEFTVAPEGLKSLYLGQKVGVRAGADGNLMVEPFVNEDPSIRYTGLNNQVKIKKGNLKSCEPFGSVTKLTVEIDEKEITCIYYGETKAQSGGDYDFEVIYTNDGEVINQLYDNRFVKTVKINGFIRDEDGTLTIYAKDEQDEKYLIPIRCKAVNFNFTDLCVGDELKVYYETISDNLPMEVEAIRIDKI